VLQAKERNFGPNSLEVASSAGRLALLYYCEGKYDSAEPLYKKAVRIRELNLGAKDPIVLQTLQYYAALLRQEGRKEEAQKVESRSARSEVGSFQ
jgi:tetratricopeptide (TPR) repeat protein